MIALSLSSTFLSVIMTSISSNATEDERYVFPIFDESTNNILKDEFLAIVFLTSLCSRFDSVTSPLKDKPEQEKINKSV